jgi:histidine triad (HIT) family protein
MADDPGCVFCRIRDGEVPAAMVVADERVVAFLDARPLFSGHVLVIPRDHYETLGDLPEDLLGPLFRAVQRISIALPRALASDGTFVAENNVVSQSVAHVHVHVVPRRFKDGLRGFFWPRGRYANVEEMEAVAARIRAAL